MRAVTNWFSEDSGARSAALSTCDRYRYGLRQTLGPKVPERVVAFCMLNPSTADAHRDDPTWRRCRGFAERFGASDVLAVNAYALRATDPRNLKACIRDEGVAAAVGPLNAHFLRGVPPGALRIVAWGAHCPVEHAEAVAVAFSCGGQHQLYCLGETKSGSPRHPLMLPNAARLSVWRSGEPCGWIDPEHLEAQ